MSCLANWLVSLTAAQDMDGPTALTCSLGVSDSGCCCYAKHTCTYTRWEQHLQKANHLSRCFTCGMPMWQLAGRVSLTLGPSSSASWPTPFGTRGACPRIYLSSLQSSVWRNSNQSYTYIIIVCTLLYRYVPLYDTVTLICDRRRRSNPNDKPVSEPFLPCL